MPGLNPERADIIPAGLAVAAEVLEHFADAAAHRLGVRAPRGPPPPPGPARSAAGERRAEAAAGAAPLRRAVPHRPPPRRAGAAPRASASSTSSASTSAAPRRTGTCSRPRRCCTTSAPLVSYRGHHRHSYHLIAHAEALPLHPDQRCLVAVISRYHRKAPPSKKHPEFARADARRSGPRVRRIAAHPARRRRARPRPRLRRRGGPASGCCRGGCSWTSRRGS